MPAARGADADVPVCDSVHFPCRSVVTTFCIAYEPLLNVVANVDEQRSKYQGEVPCSVAELIDSV